MPRELDPTDAPFDGRWWSPDDPDHIVGGRLLLDGEVWRVDLLGWIGPWDEGQADMVFPTTLHGSVGGVPVTLLDLVGSNVQSTVGKPPHGTEIFANTVLVGTHCGERPIFSWAGVRLLHLNEWGDRSPWRVGHEGGEETVSFTFPDHLSADVPGATIALTRDRRQSRGRLTSVTMSSDEWIYFSYDEPCDLAAVEHEWVRPMSGLLELAANSAGVPLELLVVLAGDEWTNRVTVLSAAPRTPPPKPRHHFELLFKLADVDFATVLPRWWALHRDLGPVSDLVAAMRRPVGYTSEQFLIGASAVEGYHRHRVGRARATPEHKALIKQIVDAAPEDSRKWLKEKLAHSHEPTFAQRIDEVVSIAGRRFIEAVGNVDAWRKWVKDGRNSVAHRDPGMLDIDQEWRTTIPITTSLQWLMNLVLLRDLGLSDEAIEKGLKRERGLRFAQLELQAAKPEWYQP